MTEASSSLQQRETGPHYPIVSSVNVSTVPATALLSLGVRQKKHCAIKPQPRLWGPSARQVCCWKKNSPNGHGIILSNSGAGGFEVVAFTCTLARQMSKAFLQAYILWLSQMAIYGVSLNLTKAEQWRSAQSPIKLQSCTLSNFSGLDSPHWESYYHNDLMLRNSDILLNRNRAL